MGDFSYLYDDIANVTGDKSLIPPKTKALVSPYDSLFEKYGNQHGVDPDLLRSMTHQESTYKPGAVSPKGAQGLMQLMPGTAQRFGVTNPFDPEQNIAGGTKYIKWLLDRYNGDVDKALAGYNAGEGNVDKYNGIPPFKETRNYVKNIRSKYTGPGYLKAKETAPDYSFLGNDIAEVVGRGPSDYSVIQSDIADFADNKGGQTVTPPVPTPQPVAPIPEHPDTLEAQLQSTLDPHSPKAGILTTDPTDAAQLANSPAVGTLLPVPTANGTLWLHKTKAAQLGITTPQQADAYIKQNGIAPLIGKAEQNENTTAGPTVLTTAPDGTELSASRVSTPQTAQQQISLDRQAFPQGQSQIVDAQDVVQKRAEEPVDLSQPPATYPNKTIKDIPVPDIFTPAFKPTRMGTVKPMRPKGQVSVSLNPNDFTVNGERVTDIAQPDTSPVRARNDAEILKGQAGATTVDYSQAPQGTDLNRYAIKKAITPLATEYGIDDATVDKWLDQSDPSKYLNAPVTPEDVAAMQKAGEKPVGKVYVTNATVNDLLKFAKGGEGIHPELDANIRAKSAQYYQQANQAPDLTANPDYSTKDAEWLNKNAGRLLIPTPEPVFNSLPQSVQDGLNNIGASLAAGVPIAGAEINDALAAIARPVVSKDVFDYMREVSAGGRKLGEKAGDGGIVSEIAKFAGAAPGRFSRLYLLTRLPGGNVTGMALDSALQSAGRGAEPWQILKQAGKGAAMGAVFEAAPFAGALIKGTEPMIPHAVGTVGTIFLGSAAVASLFGDPEKQALIEGGVNALLYLGQAVLGKSVRFRNAKGEEANAEVDPSGEVKLLKGAVKEPDAEVFVNTERDANGVYRPVGDTSTDRIKEEPYSVGNRGNRVGTSPEPAQLQENNPQRIETADPVAVQRAGIDTRARKVADALSKQTDFITTDELAKITRLNPTNVQDAVMTLYGARQVEILPGNRVKLIDANEVIKSTDLFEKAKTYGQTPEVLSQSASVGKAASVPAAKAPSPTEALATYKQAFKLPLIEPTDPINRARLKKTIDVTFETESGTQITRQMTVERRQKQLMEKGNILNKLLDCIHA